VQPTADGFKVRKPIDPRDDWAPFTDDECASYEIAFEALDRDGMQNPIDRDVVVTTPATMESGRKPSRVKGGTGNGSRSRAASTAK
jgi:hypothetical protein